jgi:hypothetical protein
LFLEFVVEVFANYTDRAAQDRFDPLAPHNNSFFNNQASKSLAAYNASRAGGHCAKTPDCPVKQYCDYLQTCYDCSYLTEKCDAIDGDCCSASFLHNCPSNPLKSKCHPCEAALVAACPSTRTKAFDWAQCAGVHQHDLKAAGCSNDEVARWCSGQPVDPPPPPPPCADGVLFGSKCVPLAHCNCDNYDTASGIYTECRKCSGNATRWAHPSCHQTSGYTDVITLIVDGKATCGVLNIYNGQRNKKYLTCELLNLCDNSACEVTKLWKPRNGALGL